MSESKQRFLPQMTEYPEVAPEGCKRMNALLQNYNSDAIKFAENGQSLCARVAKIMTDIAEDIKEIGIDITSTTMPFPFFSNGTAVLIVDDETGRYTGCMRPNMLAMYVIHDSMPDAVLETILSNRKQAHLISFDLVNSDDGRDRLLSSMAQALAHDGQVPQMLRLEVSI